MRFTFFWKGMLSQWSESPFVLDERTFNCAEQWMMYSKALLFQDYKAAKDIMAVRLPSVQKSIGREVQDFDNTTWIRNREEIVYRGNYAKFTQNKDHLITLMKTGSTYLVEARPEDKVWGIGLAEDDPDAQIQSKWKGLNLLGQVITRVRNDLIQELLVK